jgi:hypothetical protein
MNNGGQDDETKSVTTATTLPQPLAKTPQATATTGHLT